jgi:hypothetical protein
MYVNEYVTKFTQLSHYALMKSTLMRKNRNVS